ncbi:MAG: long-chain fatty acid--CoA ligase [Gallionella sp.]|nr:long-chain fatty acid--CoA ligase [Gallionella sp.]MDD4958537.1 long-chain fatty acid--CoA ligase [Gallionella sp.]
MTDQDIISPAQAQTLHGLFLERVRRSPDKVAYRHFLHHAWHDITWREMSLEVGRWQAALSQLGLQSGDRVAIMLRNCPQWIVFDQAALSLGLVVVPLYTVDRPGNVAIMLQDSGAKVLFFESAEQWQALRTVSDQLNDIECFISLHSLHNHHEPRLQSAQALLPVAAPLMPYTFCKTHTLATIIYTSGTTGKPKGVMLSHANLLANAHATLGVFPVRTDDVFLSFLPLSHALERTLGYYLTVMAGAEVAFARSIPQLPEDLQTIRPTLLISVPRVYERILTTINHKLAASSGVARALFQLTVAVGWARFEYQQGRGAWQVRLALWKVLDSLVARKVLLRLGGNLRSAFSGGAALSPDISRVLIGLGLPIVQGYGLTETSPVVTANRLDNNIPDSVGKPIQDVQVRLDQQSVLWVKGVNVMQGYWQNPEATRAVLDADGWLNTGDIASIHHTGHIQITGRVKEIIVMSNGEKISPSDMEMAISQDPLFEQVMIYGEGQPYLIAIVVLNLNTWLDFAHEIGVRPDMLEAFTDSRVQGKILKRISLSLNNFPSYAYIRRVLLLQEPWSVENGFLTPTLKLKRDLVIQHYAVQIQKLYERH